LTDLNLTLEGPRRVVFGRGSLDQLGREVRRLDGTRILVVADPRVAELDFFPRALDSLHRAGLSAVVFTDFSSEPAPEQADEAGRLARERSLDLVIGLGGGSAMDMAKAAAVLAANGGRAEDYIGVELVPHQGLPKLMVPTTAGTGSEVTWTAVFTMRAEKRKGGINSPYLYPETALLDPELTFDLPPEATAYTGLDALAHAVESYVSQRANPVSDMYALKAVELIGRFLERAVTKGGGDPEAREGMLLGSFLAGKALAGAGVGACHGLAYPLGAFHGVGHGTANAVLLSQVMLFNCSARPERYAALARALGLDCAGLDDLDAGRLAAERVAELVSAGAIPAGLSGLGIPEAALEEMAEAALKVKLCMDNNPRPMSREEALALYRAAY